MKRLAGQIRLPKMKMYMDVLRKACWLSSVPLTDKRVTLRVPAQ